MASRQPSIDAVRGIAIISVLGWHVFNDYLVQQLPAFFKPITSVLWTGVDLFFVLSGFLIGTLLLRNVESDNYYSTFYARRALRILPLYIVALIIAVVFNSKENIWSCLIFSQNFVWSAANRWGDRYLGVTWSLAVEEQFYLLLPLMVRLIPRRVFLSTVIILIAAAPAARLLMLAMGWRMPVYMLLPARMDALFIGVAIAWCLLERRALVQAGRPFILAMAVLLGVGFYCFARTTGGNVFSPVIASFGYTWIALFYACIITLAATSMNPFPMVLRPLAWVGLGAYSMYLFHLSLGPLIPSVALYIGLNMPLAWVACLTVVATACWCLVERPCINFGHARFKYGRKESRGAISIPSLEPEAEMAKIA